jgi:hypothetical protein
MLLLAIGVEALWCVATKSPRLMISALPARKSWRRGCLQILQSMAPAISSITHCRVGSFRAGRHGPLAMLKRYLAVAALLLALAPCVASAQMAVIAPTAPPGDNSDRIANTAFVQAAVGGGGGLPSLPAAEIWIGSAGNVATAQAISGDCTITALGAITCPKANGTAFGTLAFVTGGTGVAAAATNTLNAAGGLVGFSGALGTPSSGNGSNLTALNASSLATGTVAVSVGGTGDNSFTANCLLIGNGTSPLGCVAANSGNSSLPYLSQGGSLPGVFAQLSNAALVNSSITVGSTGVSLGGTAATIAGLTLSSPAFTGTASGSGTIPVAMLTGTLGFANGGCNATTQTGCINNVHATPTRAGDVEFWNGTAWVTLAGNNSGTQVFSENASGVPAWITPSGSGTVTGVTCFGTTITSTGTCVAAAAKSDQQAGTSATLAVTPSQQQQQHDSAAKAWAEFGSCTSSPCTLNASYNVSSITRQGVGQYTVNFSTAFASANYACAINPGDSTSSGYGSPGFSANPTASAFEFVATTGAAARDFGCISVVCFGRQ